MVEMGKATLAVEVLAQQVHRVQVKPEETLLILLVGVEAAGATTARSVETARARMAEREGTTTAAQVVALEQHHPLMQLLVLMVAVVVVALTFMLQGKMVALAPSGIRLMALVAVVVVLLVLALTETVVMEGTTVVVVELDSAALDLAHKA
jgi:hypothetical protein